MKIESWPIDRPKPYGKNPRKITDEAVRKVAVSIQQFGFRQPIVVDVDGVVVVGHVRLAAAKRLVMMDVPVHVAEDLSADEIRALRLADNRAGEETQWDEPLLEDEMRRLLGEDGDDPSQLLIATGFDDEEIDALLAVVEPVDDSAGGAGMSSPVIDTDDADDEAAEASDGDAKQAPLGKVYELVIECADEATQQAVKELIESAELEGVEDIRVTAETIG